MDITKAQKDFHELMSEKGFKLNEHVKQLLLIASEVSEALELVVINDCPVWLLEIFDSFQKLMTRFEAIRKNAFSINAYLQTDEDSKILDKEMLGEELADIVYRVFSYAEASDINLSEHLAKKHEYNKLRPKLHGKRF